MIEIKDVLIGEAAIQQRAINPVGGLVVALQSLPVGDLSLHHHGVAGRRADQQDRGGIGIGRGQGRRAREPRLQGPGARLVEAKVAAARQQPVPRRPEVLDRDRAVWVGRERPDGCLGAVGVGDIDHDLVPREISGGRARRRQLQRRLRRPPEADAGGGKREVQRRELRQAVIEEEAVHRVGDMARRVRGPRADRIGDVVGPVGIQAIHQPTGPVSAGADIDGIDPLWEAGEAAAVGFDVEGAIGDLNAHLNDARIAPVVRRPPDREKLVQGLAVNRRRDPDLGRRDIDQVAERIHAFLVAAGIDAEEPQRGRSGEGDSPAVDRRIRRRRRAVAREVDRRASHVVDAVQRDCSAGCVSLRWQRRCRRGRRRRINNRDRKRSQAIGQRRRLTVARRDHNPQMLAQVVRRRRTAKLSRERVEDRPSRCILDTENMILPGFPDAVLKVGVKL